MLTFAFEENTKEINNFITKIESFAFSKDYRNCFAFTYSFKLPANILNGYKVLNDLEDYKRMGLELFNEVM